jgi:hypothetical protein
MYQDPIVEEIHQTRAQILAQHQGKFETYFASLMKNQRDRQRVHPEHYVSFELQNLAKQTGSKSVNTPQASGEHATR